MGCKEHVTFLATEDLAIMEAPARSRSAPNRVVGTMQKGTLIQNAPVIRGMDYRYFEVTLPDGGLGFVRGGGRQMQIYKEE